MDNNQQQEQEDDNQQSREDVVEGIITSTIFDDSINLKALLEVASEYEVAQAIRYMEKYRDWKQIGRAHV